MTIEEAIKIIKAAMETMYLPKSKSYISDFGYALEWLIQRNEQKWIPIKFRELTEEENEQFGDECDKAFDCLLPDDDQEVLVSTKWGVDKDTFCIDGYGMYFENYDADDLLAWMPLPEPYKEVSQAIVNDSQGLVKEVENG